MGKRRRREEREGGGVWCVRHGCKWIVRYDLSCVACVKNRSLSEQ